MFSDLRKGVKKVGQPPGTALYTGKNKAPSCVHVIRYTEHDFHETTGNTLKEALPDTKEKGITWINVEGLNNVSLIEEVASLYQLHPLTVEDILNVEQRPKIDEYEKYLYVSLKILVWNDKRHTYSIEPFNIIFGKNFVLTFIDHKTDIFHLVHERLRSGSMQRLRQQGSDYLAYRLIDTIVDQYFVVLEGLGELIETTEELIIASPTQQNSRTIYRLKRKMLLLRKIVWPMREVISHLLQAEEKLVTPFTRVYLRDIYDHVVQAIDNIEMFRDMLSSMLDMYLSSLTNRMNEVIKVLTVISTIFIPITFIASLYGMNFSSMPELHWRYGYQTALLTMILIVVIMLIYFRRKKWI